MTKMNKSMLTHHNGRGNMKAVISLLINEVETLWTKIEALEAKLAGEVIPADSHLLQPKAAAKVAPGEFLEELKNKLEAEATEITDAVAGLNNDPLVHAVEEFVETAATIVEAVEGVEHLLGAEVEEAVEGSDGLEDTKRKPTSKKK